MKLELLGKRNEELVHRLDEADAKILMDEALLNDSDEQMTVDSIRQSQLQKRLDDVLNDVDRLSLENHEQSTEIGDCTMFCACVRELLSSMNLLNAAFVSCL